MKAQTFLSLLQRIRPASRGNQTAATAREEEELRIRLSEAYRLLGRLEFGSNEESSLLVQIKVLMDELRGIERSESKLDSGLQPPVATLEEVQATLDSRSAFLGYAMATGSSTLVCVTKEKIAIYDLSGSEVNSHLQQFLKNLRSPQVNTDNIRRHISAGRALYELLVAPAEKLVRGKEHLVISPDGPLHYLPFEALVQSDGTGGMTNSRAKVPYLIRQYRVTYTSSASVFVRLAKARSQTVQARSVLMAFGDPVFPSEPGPSQIDVGQMSPVVLRSQLSRLPFSEREVKAIASIWKVSTESGHINLAASASMSRLNDMNLSDYRILHFATHGLLMDEVRYLSEPALALSSSDSQMSRKNLLTMTDVMALKLNADLVVLSACDTGLGRYRDGEGVVGLARAFMQAGAKAVVVSLWQVQDESTSILMARFHERLKNGEGKAEALRNAKLDVMSTVTELEATGTRQSLASPFYWAPFILIGDGSANIVGR